MTGLTITGALERVKIALSQSDKDSIAVQLLCHIINKPRSYLMAWPEAEITDSQIKDFDSALEQLQKGKPLAYVLGCQPFWDLELIVNEHTLIPRPDTEVVIEQALALGLSDTAKVLDLGTGTGAIALALAQEQPRWQITAVDFSLAALEVAKQNAVKHQIESVTFLHSNWFANIQGQFDLIISNPPYIEAEDEHLAALSYEPITALASGKDGLDDIRLITSESVKYLMSRGYLLFEHGYNQAEAVQIIMQKSGLVEIHSGKDYGDNWRWTCGQLSEKTSDY